MGLEAATPSPETVELALREVYGRPHHHNKRDPLGELIYIVLSTQTREAEYRRTFSALWNTYRSWDRVRTAPAAEVEDLIRFGGFARRKVALIQAMLSKIHADTGKTSLRFLAELPDDQVLNYLCSLPGVGLKTARCVMMYSLGRAVLPVDTHVWRVAQRLGWVGGGKHPDDRRSVELETAVPSELRHSLHVTLMALGRERCRAKPSCEGCPIRSLCPKPG